MLASLDQSVLKNQYFVLVVSNLLQQFQGMLPDLFLHWPLQQLNELSVLWKEYLSGLVSVSNSLAISELESKEEVEVWLEQHEEVYEEVLVLNLIQASQIRHELLVFCMLLLVLAEEIFELHSEHVIAWGGNDFLSSGDFGLLVKSRSLVVPAISEVAA